MAKILTLRNVLHCSALAGDIGVDGIAAIALPWHWHMVVPHQKPEVRILACGNRELVRSMDWLLHYLARFPAGGSGLFSAMAALVRGCLHVASV